MLLNETRDIVAQLVARERRPPQPFGLYVVGTTDPTAELARRVERDVFLERFGNSGEMLRDEYDPYESASVFLLVVDHAKVLPAGEVRIILPSPAGLKTIHDALAVWGVHGPGGEHRPPWVSDSTWDISTLAVTAEYRGHRTNGVVSAALFQGISMLLGPNQVSQVIATLDLRVLKLIQRHADDPFVPFEGATPRRYLNSPASLPVYFDVSQYQSRLQRDAPLTYQRMFGGVGLETVLSVPAWGPISAGPQPH